MKYSTPILAAVKAMHIEQDAREGVDPYNTLTRLDAVAQALRASQLREAEQNLACYATELTLEDK